MKAVRQFKILAAAAAVIFMTAAGAFADELPRIAVYVNSTLLPSENRALERSVMSTIFKSGRYKVIDRSAETSSMLAAEHIKQRDGSVNNEQIKKLGTQLGVDFVCMPDITRAFNTWNLSVSIIDVETAEIVSIGEESFIEMYMDKLKTALDKVLGEMLDAKTTAAPAVTGTPGQILMMPKYDGTEVYATEYLAAYGLPIAIVGTNDILTVIGEGKSYYKIRTASGNVGFVLKRFLVSGNTQFVDMNKKPAEQETAEAVNYGQGSNAWDAAATPQAGETPKQGANEHEPEYRQLDNRIGIEFGFGLGWQAVGLVTNIYKDSKEQVSFGAEGRLDLIYFESYAYNYAVNVGGEAVIAQNGHYLLKFPIGLESVKISPLLGLTISTVTSISSFDQFAFSSYQFALGGRIDYGLSQTFYMTTEYLHGFSGNSNSQSFKLGAGFDRGIGEKKKWYWRPELMYRFTRIAYYEGATYISGNQVGTLQKGQKMEMSINALRPYIGIGYKFGGNKQHR